MKRTILFIMIMSFWLLSSCGDFAIKESLTRNYYLIASDVKEDINLSYDESGNHDGFGTVIDATVFAVGYNDKYIIAKQHPRNFPNPPNKKITNYYILPIKEGMDWKNKNGLIGPLTKEEFNEKQKELMLEELAFTKEMEDLK